MQGVNPATRNRGHSALSVYRDAFQELVLEIRPRIRMLILLFVSCYSAVEKTCKFDETMHFVETRRVVKNIPPPRF